MATLEENLQEIKNQKDTFIKPENLKEGITCFGITGTLTGNTTTKIYDTVETMQADTTQADGTICIVGIRDVDKSETNRPDINIFELPENIPASDVTTGTLITFGNGTFGITDTNIYIEAMENMVTDQYTLYTKTGDNYIRESGLGLLNAITDITGGRNTGYYAEFQMLDNKVYNYIKFKYSKYMNLDVYNASAKTWTQLTNDYTASANDLVKGITALSKTGVIKGTLDVRANIPMSMFKGFGGSDLHSGVTSGNVENLTPTSSILINNKICPDIANKKYLYIKGEFNDGMGMNKTYYKLYTTPDIDTVITVDENFNVTSTSSNWTEYTLNECVETNYLNCFTWSNIQYILNQTFTEGTTGNLNFTNWDPELGMLISQGGTLSTNCKFVHKNGKVICEANGPETTAVGSYYTNIKGELIAGTMKSGLDTSDATAESKYLAADKTAYVKGEKITGTAELCEGSYLSSRLIGSSSVYYGVNASSTDIQFRWEAPTNKTVLFNGGGLDTVVLASELAQALEIVPSKLLKGSTILGVTGTTTTPKNSGVVIASSIDELNNNTTQLSNTIGVIPKITTSRLTDTPIRNTTSQYMNNITGAIIVPKVITLTNAMTSSWTRCNIMFDTTDQVYNTIYYLYENNEYKIVLRNYYWATSGETYKDIEVWKSTDGTTFTNTNNKDLIISPAVSTISLNSYTPAKSDFDTLVKDTFFALNYDSPELYLWNGTAWTQINN